MDKLLSNLEALTQSLVMRLHVISYEEVSVFIEEREQLVDHINQLKQQEPFTAEQTQRLRQILQSDAVILSRMAALKTEASDWLQQRGQAKTQRNAYEAAYTPDSMLMDRRK